MGAPPTRKQFSFVAGEISPRLIGRADVPMHRNALRTCRNFVVLTEGAVRNRTGSRFVREVKDSSKRVRLVSFVVANAQAYVLELGEGYIRFHKTAGTVFAASGAHTGGTDATVMTDGTANFTVDGLIGMTIYNTTDGSSGVITDNDATTVTVAALTGGTDNEWKNGDAYEIPYEIATAYTENDLMRVRWAQQNNVMWLVHPDHPPYELRRIADAEWRLQAYSITANRPQPPTALTLSAPGFDTTTLENLQPQEWDWVVCTVDSQGRRSLPSQPLQRTDATLYPGTTHPKITWTAPTSGPTPAYYEVFRGRDEVYGYVGRADHELFVDRALDPDFSDSPPEGRDPFENTDLALGDIISEPFAGDTSFKNTTPEAAGDAYDFHYSITFDEGEEITLDFEARPDAISGWTNLGTRTHKWNDGVGGGSGGSGGFDPPPY